MRTTIQTSSGLELDPFKITPADININDIAAALSKLCRFQGHTKQHYSVAQHSVMVARRCPKVHQLSGLLHDATEAYVCDLVSPLKERPEFAFYRELEASVNRAVCLRFGIPEEMPGVVHLVDKRVFVTEARDLMTRPIGFDNLWPYEETIIPVTPEEAERLFLLAFRSIKRGEDIRWEFNNE